MMSTQNIPRKLEEVETGDYLLWNGRTIPQPVVDEDKDAMTFEVEGSRGGRYRFYRTGEPRLLNLNSSTEYDVKELTILRGVEID